MFNSKLLFTVNWSNESGGGGGGDDDADDDDDDYDDDDDDVDENPKWPICTDQGDTHIPHSSQYLQHWLYDHIWT